MIPLREAAKQLGVSPERVRQLIRKGRIPGAIVEPVFGRYMLPVDFFVTPPKGRETKNERIRAKEKTEKRLAKILPDSFIEEPPEL